MNYMLRSSLDVEYIHTYIYRLAPRYFVAACGGLTSRAQPLHVSLPLAGYLDRRGNHPPISPPLSHLPLSKSNFYFTPPSTFTLKFELLTQPQCFWLWKKLESGNMKILTPNLVLESERRSGFRWTSAESGPVFPAIPFLPSTLG